LIKIYPPSCIWKYWSFASLNVFRKLLKRSL